MKLLIDENKHLRVPEPPQEIRNVIADLESLVGYLHGGLQPQLVKKVWRAIALIQQLHEQAKCRE